MLRLSQSTWISVTDARVVRSMTSSNSMNSICRLRRRRIPTTRPVRVSNAAKEVERALAHVFVLDHTGLFDGCAGRLRDVRVRG
jgi:hypothetical protein